MDLWLLAEINGANFLQVHPMLPIGLSDPNLASPEEKMAAPESHNQLQLVAFTLGDQEYAIPVELVESIVKTGKPTPVPGAPSHVRGIMSFRAMLISVVDLRHRFGMDRIEDESDCHVLVMRSGESMFGIMVDNVSDVFMLENDALQPLPPGMGSQNAAGIDGIIRSGDRLIILLKLEAMVDTSEVAARDNGEAISESAEADAAHPLPRPVGRQDRVVRHRKRKTTSDRRAHGQERCW